MERSRSRCYALYFTGFKSVKVTTDASECSEHEKMFRVGFIDPGTDITLNNWNISSFTPHTVANSVNKG